jgi:hypothetical protein
MRESCGEGLANHTDPESCAMARKDQGEALTGARAGRVLSREIFQRSGSRRRQVGRKATVDASLPQDAFAPCAVGDPECTHGNTSHGNREIPWSPPEGGRTGKSKDTSR